MANVDPHLRTCNNCLKPGKKLKLCSRCSNVRYCDATCQTTHWRLSHKQHCAGMKLPRGDPNHTVCTRDDVTHAENREMITAWLEQRQKNFKGPYCMICGDHDKLVRTPNGILCSECQQLQLLLP